MIYAKVHDRTVAEDYYTAMARIEKSIELAGDEETGVWLRADEKTQLLEMLSRLDVPRLGRPDRNALVEQLRQVLMHEPAAMIQ